jgi:hypothetical protein
MNADAAVMWTCAEFPWHALLVRSSARSLSGDLMGACSGTSDKMKSLARSDGGVATDTCGIITPDLPCPWLVILNSWLPPLRTVLHSCSSSQHGHQNLNVLIDIFMFLGGWCGGLDRREGNIAATVLQTLS